MRLWAIGERWACDIDVDPRHVSDELLEELCCGDRTAPASFANVLDVRNFAFDLFVEERKHRQLPHGFALFAQRIALAESQSG